MTFCSWETAADLDHRLNSPLAAIYRRHINQQWDAILAVFYCVWGGGGGGMGGVLYIYMYIYTNIHVCVCVCVYAYMYVIQYCITYIHAHYMH